MSRHGTSGQPTFPRRTAPHNAGAGGEKTARLKGCKAPLRRGLASDLPPNPQPYAEYAVEVIDKRLEERMKDIRQTASDLLKASSYTREVLSTADQDRTDAQRQLWEREQKLNRFKSRLRWFGLGAVVLALAMTVTLPRFLASYGPTCGVLGGVWTATSTDIDVCAFYRE